MNQKPRQFTPEQDQFLQANSDMTAPELARALGVRLCLIYSAGKSLGLTFKPAKKHAIRSETFDRSRRIPSYTPDKKSTVVRPEARYDNIKSNYISD